MVLGLGPGLGLGLVDAIKGARGHGDMGTRGETGLNGRPETGKDAGGKYTPANHPVSGFPLSGSVPIRQPLTANRFHL